MSKIEDQDSSLYYVIRKGFFKRIVVAKIDPNTKCFYDYHVKEDVVNYAGFQIGQSIRIDENKGFEIVDPNINEEVVKIIEQDNSFYKKCIEEISHNNRLLILGTGGVGKTTIANKVILYLLQKYKLQNIQMLEM